MLQHLAQSGIHRSIQKVYIEVYIFTKLKASIVHNNIITKIKYIHTLSQYL